jgi:hypothetical protein
MLADYPCPYCARPVGVPGERDCRCSAGPAGGIDVVNFLRRKGFRSDDDVRWQTPEHWHRQQEGTLIINSDSARIDTDDGYTIFHVETTP